MNKSATPFISIVTVVFNGAVPLEKTILNIRQQSHTDFEHVIIDGGSTDGTVDVIKKYDDKIAFWVSEKDQGIYDAMNKSLQFAHGKWLIFLNAGDTFYDENSLKSFVDFVDHAKERYDLVFGDVLVVDGDKEYIRSFKNTFGFLLRNMICHQCMFYSRGVFEKAGDFNKAYRMTADFDHLMRIKTLGLNIGKVPAVIARYGLDGVSATEKGIRKIWDERIRIFSSDKTIPWFTRLVYGLYAKTALKYRELRK